MANGESSTYPALNIIGGKRCIKERSSLNNNKCELFPPLISRIITPAAKLCHKTSK